MNLAGRVPTAQQILYDAFMEMLGKRSALSPQTQLSWLGNELYLVHGVNVRLKSPNDLLALSDAAAEAALPILKGMDIPSVAP